MIPFILRNPWQIGNQNKVLLLVNIKRRSACGEPHSLDPSEQHINLHQSIIPGAEITSARMFSKPSPSFARKGHQQITGSDADEKDRVIAGVQFNVRYIGSTEVACANGTGSGKTEKPVAQVFDQHRRNSNGKTNKKMILTLCSKSLSVSDEACGKLVASFPIAKITFCNIDNFYDKAFVFVARDKSENPFKAFVFTCESKAKAREAFKALSLAFIINYECYQASLTRCVPNGNEVSRSPESNGTFFNGMAEVGIEGKSANGNLKKSEQLRAHHNGEMPLRKESCPPIINGFHLSRQEGSPSPPRARPIQNKTLLKVTDYRRHVRSASDPTQLQIGKMKAPMPPTSPLASGNTPIHAPVPNNNAADAVLEEDEFTEFAELRSKCRSSSELAKDNCSGSVWEGFQRYDSAPNVWGSFQNACPPIY